MNINHNKIFRLGQILIAFLVIITFSCKKKEIIGENPYAGGKEALGIKFDKALPDPELASQGSEVDVLVRGLKKYEGDNPKFYVNETEAVILAFTDSTARIKVPENASTGGLSIVVKGQTFFGPVLRIDGKVSIDATFHTNGSDNTIYDVIRQPNSNYILAGAFRNFDNKATEALPNGGIVQINNSASYVGPDASFNTGKGANGVLNSIIKLTSGPYNGKYIVAGSFSSYNSTRSNRINISGITRLNSNGSLDTVVYDVINPTPNNIKKNRDTVPRFNGGVTGTIRKAFVYGDRVYVVGNFSNYVRNFYERSTYDFKVKDFTKMNQMVCMKINQTDTLMEGSMDSTFHFNPVTKQSPSGGNGYISDAIQQADGKLIIVGSFTTFNDMPAKRIVRINLDGSVDNTFNAGSGADDDITAITYNATTNKIIVCGLFKNFNGSAQSGVAMLEADGSLSTGFNFGTMGSGIANFAAQLNNGKIIVSGNFNSYNNVIRQGFMILNPDGQLAPGYNNTGLFQGQIFKMIETTSGLGNPAVILMGKISRFDNKSFGNIVRVELKN